MLNYSLRPNKAVERRLIFERIRSLSTIFSFKQYRYVGMGSLWFADFLLAHRELAISQFDSIESDPVLADRAEFSRPLSRVRIHRGRSKDVLPQLRLSFRPTIIWLDYTGGLDVALPDIPIISSALPSGSIVLITINARRNQFSIPPNTPPADAPTAWLTAFRSVAGAFSPPSLRASDLREGARSLSQTLGHTLIIALDHHVKQRAGYFFEPLFNIAYADTSHMITAGGMIVDTVDAIRLRDHPSRNASGFTPSTLQPPVETLNVPTLTSREKHVLDRLLPAATLRKNQLPLLLSLSQNELDDYHRHYLRYPLYLEVELT